MLHGLPVQLRIDLLVNMLENKFGHVPIFGRYGRPFIRALAPHFERRVFIPDDVVIEVWFARAGVPKKNLKLALKDG